MMKNRTLLRGFLVGAVAGTAAGLLLAPKTGKETRHALKAKAGKAGQAVGSFRRKNHQD